MFCFTGRKVLKWGWKLINIFESWIWNLFAWFYRAVKNRFVFNILNIGSILDCLFIKFNFSGQNELVSLNYILPQRKHKVFEWSFTYCLIFVELFNIICWAIIWLVLFGWLWWMWCNPYVFGLALRFCYILYCITQYWNSIQVHKQLYCYILTF